MYRNRISFLIALSVLMTVGLSFRLFSLSVVHHGEYVAKAEQQQNVERDVVPRRGDLFAQDASSGSTTLVAESVERFAVSATPKNVKKKAAYAAVLASHAGVDQKTVQDELETDALYMAPLKHDLTKHDVEAIAADLNKIEDADSPKRTDVVVNFDPSQGNVIYFIGGVFFVREYARIYPEGALMGQLLGFVDDKGNGQYGVEGEYNNNLKGYIGRVLVQQDSVGTLLNQKDQVRGADGTSYELSIDRNVQYEVEKDLAQELKDSEAEGGSVIVMDPKTGEVIAMAASPSYDPNSYRDLTQAQVGLFDNPNISKEWEPGSIFKPLVMAAAMDQGLVTPDTKNTFGESVTVEGHVINTALRRAYGEETMTQVLANSDNVAMVWVSDKLGNQKMYDYLKSFGFGSSTGVDLKNEISGSVLQEKKWRDINRATISFGQGIAVTPMQIVTAYAAIANDGKMVLPRVVKATIDPNGTRHPVATVEGQQVVKPEIAKQLRDMMVATVVTSHNRAGTEGYKIGGKTGTAQIPDPKNGGYIEDAYNHSFIGIGPSDNPRYVALVKIDHPNIKKVGTYAESTAVPLFGKISSFLLNYYQIPPTNR